jgi:Holliday junction resolvase RusA-like endonuclease
MNNICITLPEPPSVNRLRKRAAWIKKCDIIVFVLRRDTFNRGLSTVIGSPYGVRIVLDRMSRIDMDNCIKPILDYLCRAKIVTDDGPGHLHRILVERGDVGEKKVNVHIEEW